MRNSKKTETGSSPIPTHKSSDDVLDDIFSHPLVKGRMVVSDRVLYKVPHCKLAIGVREKILGVIDDEGFSTIVPDDHQDRIGIHNANRYIHALLKIEDRQDCLKYIKYLIEWARNQSVLFANYVMLLIHQNFPWVAQHHDLASEFSAIEKSSVETHF